MPWKSLLKAIAYRQDYHKQHREERNAYMRAYSKRKVKELRDKAFAAYGNVCKCCGETRWEFLTVDHVNGGGSAHKRITGKGHTFYRWLEKAGYPQDEFRLLCYNCNCVRGRLGYCPHERESK